MSDKSSRTLISQGHTVSDFYRRRPFAHTSAALAAKKDDTQLEELRAGDRHPRDPCWGEPPSFPDPGGVLLHKCAEVQRSYDWLFQEHVGRLVERANIRLGIGPRYTARLEKACS